MHEQINIEDIIVHESEYKKLVPLISKMKSIEVVHDLDQFKDSNRNISFLDKIVASLSFIKDLKSKLFYFKDDKGDEINYELVEFNRIKRISFDEYKYSLKKLELVCKSSLTVDEVSFCESSPNDLELLTNPIYYKNGIKSLSYQFSSKHIITDQSFINIKEINPKFIHFYDRHLISLPYFNFIQILSNLPEKTKLCIGTLYQYDKSIFTFSNTYVRIYQNDIEDSLLIYCESLSLCFEDRLIFDSMSFVNNSKNSQDKSLYAIQANKVLRAIFENFRKVIDPNEIQEIEKCFPSKLRDSSYAYEIVVPLQNLVSVELSCKIRNHKEDTTELHNFISKLSHSMSFKCHIKLDEDLNYLQGLKQIFPDHCQYFISVNKIHYLDKLI